MRLLISKMINHSLQMLCTLNIYINMHLQTKIIFNISTWFTHIHVHTPLIYDYLWKMSNILKMLLKNMKNGIISWKIQNKHWVKKEISLKGKHKGNHMVTTSLLSSWHVTYWSMGNSKISKIIWETSFDIRIINFLF